MMAEQYYQTKKRPLSTPEGASPLNKKTNSDYMIDNDCFEFCSPLIKPRSIRSRAPSPDHDHTLPPLKHHEREDNPSPEEHPNPPQPTSPEECVVEHPKMENIVSNSTTTLANTPSPQPQSVVHSCWNPEHPNPFFPLKELLDFEDPIIADSDPRYNIVTVELVPESLISKKQGDYTHVIDLEIEESNFTCKLDQSTCEHDGSMVSIMTQHHHINKQRETQHTNWIANWERLFMKTALWTYHTSAAPRK
ncbi:hypothetical protein DSO57_1023422 [Entomophthora muscae]|uniref:Uncharacterized protein n=1 Tax=Entomophthora muscae TaxID=34485 RepID=A0ACC2TDP8_9FUNG|nr:hypothetical protein DSO57_1023422 [Entomophthora muscae]